MSNRQPPYRTAFRFLRWFCPSQLLEEIEGDLLQRFERDVSRVGERRAKWRMVWNTLRFFRPGILLRNTHSSKTKPLTMIPGYLLLMVRNLQRNKFYASINLLSLTTGIVFALVIGLFVREELRVNQDLADVDRLYLVETKAASVSYREFFGRHRMTRQCTEDHPSLFENYYRFLDRNITLSKDNHHFRIQSMIGDPSLIKMFGFKVVAGNPQLALQEPNAIVVTRTVARKFFGNKNALGESLIVSTEQAGKKNYTITAVIEDPSDKNSVSDFMNMDAQVFLSFKNATDFFPNFDEDSWDAFTISYVKLATNANRDEAESAMNKIANGLNGRLTGEPRTYHLTPLADYYLITNQGAVITLIKTLSIVVVLILVLAISNFINISIGASLSRSKEVGVRKVLGGLKGQVVFQFLIESFGLTMMAWLLALAVYEVSRTYFGALLQSTLPSVIALDGSTWAILVTALVGISIVAGLYPAIHQSRPTPIASLKGKASSVSGTLLVSRTLLVAQFLITFIVFTSALVISRQTSFFLNKDLGYEQSNVLVVTSVPRLWDDAGFSKMEAALGEFKRLPAVRAASLSWGAPGNAFSPGGGKVYKAGQSPEQAVNHVVTSADENLFDVYSLRLLSGELLRGKSPAGTIHVVINESAKKALGVELGDQIKVVEYGDTIFTIHGIVADFHFESLRDKISPLILMHPCDFRAYRYMSFKLAGGGITEQVQQIESAWKQNFPDDPFDFEFAETKMQYMYTTELQLKKAATTATFLMFIMVVTGILGLITLSVAKRKKEIGIRKVIGASVPDILRLMSHEYVRIILLSIVLAAPIAYWLMQRWLATFVYRVELSGWEFIVPSILLLLFVILIVAAKTYRTATTNPAHIIRYE